MKNDENVKNSYGGVYDEWRETMKIEYESIYGVVCGVRRSQYESIM